MEFHRECTTNEHFTTYARRLNNGSNHIVPPKSCTLMKICTSEVILDGVLNTLNVQVSTGVSYTSNPLWAVSLQCARNAHSAKTRPVLWVRPQLYPKCGKSHRLQKHPAESMYHIVGLWVCGSVMTASVKIATILTLRQWARASVTIWQQSKQTKMPLTVLFQH